MEFMEHKNNIIKISLIALIIFVLAFVFLKTENKIIGDENWFLIDIENFAHGNATITHYNNLQTPLFFITFGFLHKYFGFDLVGLRHVNLFLFAILLFCIYYQSKNNKKSDFYKVILIIVATPYILFLSVTLYTDMMLILLLLLGFMFHKNEHYLLSLFSFALAISTRQFGVVFPFVLALTNIRSHDKRRWIYPLISCSALVFWYILFGFSLSPVVSITENSFYLFSGFLFLATYGAYYKLPELLLFPEKKSIIKHLKKFVFFMIFSIIFSLILLVINIPKTIEFLSPNHWFHALYISPFGLIFIGIFSTFSLIYARNNFERILLITSFFMFCYLNTFFDKYTVPYAVVMAYSLLKRKEL